MSALRLAEPALAARDVDASREPPDVSLKWLGKRLVEVVDVEHEPRSGAAHTPKLERCASPPRCAQSPEPGVIARSDATIAAAPLKNESGDASIRPHRIGTNSGTCEASCCSRIRRGETRSWVEPQWRWLERLAFCRAAFPRAARSLAVNASSDFRLVSSSDAVTTTSGMPLGAPAASAKNERRFREIPIRWV